MSDNSFDFFGPNGPMNGEEFMKWIRQNNQNSGVLEECSSTAMAAGYSDVAEAMHIITDEINRSDELNIAAMIPVSKIFDQVFEAFSSGLDMQGSQTKDYSKYLEDSGIVGAGLEEGHPPGEIRMYDIKLTAAFAAARFFLFSRVRKIASSLPIIRATLDDGDPEAALLMLHESVSSVSNMMNNLDKMGLSLRSDHPVAQKAQEGMNESLKLMKQITEAIIAKKKKD